MTVNISSMEEWVGYVNNESMDNIWLLVEENGLGVYMLYGCCDGRYYRDGGDYWSPLHLNDSESFLKYIDNTSIFDNNTLVKIK